MPFTEVAVQVTGPRQQLSGSVHVEHAHAVVTLAGEVDIATAPLFGALLDEAISAGKPRVTVDMVGVDFIDAHGITTLMMAAQRLRIAGAWLSVRLVSPSILRLFTLTGLPEVLGVERPSIVSGFAGQLAGVSSIPFTRDVLDAALKLVVTMAHAVVAGADGVSITVPRLGQLGTVAASNDVVLAMDHDQYDTAQGPCLDAATLGERFHVDSLDTEPRWPAFIPRARARGIQSILSTPLLTAERPVGALNIYSRAIGAFAVHEMEWADQFAAQAATVVSTAELSGSTGMQDEIGQALLSRQVITLAQGVVMERDGVSPARAYAHLRDRSRRIGIPLVDVCEELISDTGDAAFIRGLPDGSSHGSHTP